MEVAPDASEANSLAIDVRMLEPTLEAVEAVGLLYVKGRVEVVTWW